jgi:hypothetical protein
MTQTRPRQWNRSAFGELDEIVVQLFDDLANGKARLRRAAPVAKKNGPAQPNLDREIDRSVQVPTTEAARSSTEAAGSRPPKNVVSESQFDSLARDTVADDEELFTDELWYQDESASLALTPEEEQFVKDAAAWLAPRPNADLLLERMCEVVLHQDAAVPPLNGVEIDACDGSDRSSEAVRAKPATAAKRP